MILIRTPMMSLSWMTLDGNETSHGLLRSIWALPKELGHLATSQRLLRLFKQSDKRTLNCSSEWSAPPAVCVPRNLIATVNIHTICD